MKKFLFALFALLLLFSSSELLAKRPPVESLKSLCQEYKGKEGFEVVNLGPMAMSLMRTAAKMEADPDDRQAINILKGIKRMMVVDYEDSRKADRDSFNAKVEQVLKSMELLMSVMDEGETVEIYGDYDEGSALLGNVVVFMPSEGGLVAFSGSIRMEDVAALVAEAK